MLSYGLYPEGYRPQRQGVGAAHRRSRAKEELFKGSPRSGGIGKALGLDGVSLDQNREHTVGIGAILAEELLALSTGDSGIHVNGAPDVPVGHLTGSQRVNAGEGVDVVLDAVTNYGASLINCHGEFFIHGTGGVHAAVQNCGVQIGGDHHTDADVGIVVADILDIGHLVIGTAGDKLHVFTLVLCRIRFDLRIGIEGISGLIFAGVAAAFLGYIRPQFRSRGCAVGDAGVICPCDRVAAPCGGVVGKWAFHAAD